MVYVATDVLCNWECGIVVIEADSLEKAREKFKEDKEVNRIYDQDSSELVEVLDSLREIKKGELIWFEGGG